MKDTPINKSLIDNAINDFIRDFAKATIRGESR